MSWSSRWVQAPAGVTEREGLAAGFRAAGVRAGIKPSGDPDLALLVSDEPDTVSAARFTRSGVLAAPVVLCQERCRLDALRAVVANSGNANAATGRRGLEDAARMQGAASMAAGVREDQVAVASTGVIGVPLDVDKIIKGTLAARADLAPYGDDTFGEAIRTTDKFPKSAALEVALPSGTPITPVEHTATRSAATPPANAAAPCIFVAASSPRRPVAALALPELATTARKPSSRQRSCVSSTGAASTPDRVKRAALVASTRSHTSRPTSGLPLGLIPARPEAARKPRGRPPGSSATWSGRSIQRESKKLT